MRLTRQLIVVLWLIMGGVLASCGPGAGPAPTPTDNETADSPTAIPATALPTEPPATPTDEPTPAPTLVPASVSGRVLWGSNPVPGAMVELRSADNEAVVVTAEAGAAGQFLLAAVPPGEYALVAAWPDGVTNQGAPMELALESGAAASNLTLALEKPLTILEPALDAPVATLPTIAWEPVEGSSQYHVTMTAEEAAELIVDTLIAGNSLELAEQLDISQGYTLTVVALDEAGLSLGSFVGDMVTEDVQTPPRAVVLPAGCSQVGLPTFVDRTHGICFAFPQDHVMTGGQLLPTIAGPAVAAGAIYFPGLTVQNLPANGLELTQWVDDFIAEAADDPESVDRVATTVFGAAAEIFEPIPGQVSARQIAIANGANVLLLSFTPTFRDVPAEEQDFIQRKAQIAADNLFETVMATLSFLPSAGAETADGIELPAACLIDGMGLNVDAESGLCLAIPTGFTAQRTPQGLPRLIGPALDAGLSPMRATFMMQPVEELDGRTLEEVVADYVSANGGDDTTQTEVVIGGEPAVLLEHLPAGRGSHEIFVVHNDQVYHLVFQPDPAGDRDGRRRHDPAHGGCAVVILLSYRR